VSKVAAVVIACFSLLSLAFAGIGNASAQDATPTDLSSYPQINVTITDDAYQVDTDKIPAGYVVLNATNNSSDVAGVGLLGPKPGETMDDLAQQAATPAPNDGFPAFLYNAVVLGGPGDIPIGESAQQILNVPAGEWALFGPGNQPPAMVTASESADSVTEAPQTTATIEMSDFLFSGFDSLQTGSRLVAVTNTGEQPHMMILAKIPDGSTVDDVMAAMNAAEGGTPAANAIPESEITPIGGGVVLLSSGQTSWVPLDFEAGTYMAICFVTDPNTGEIHAMLGMTSVFTVGQTATPTS